MKLLAREMVVKENYKLKILETVYLQKKAGILTYILVKSISVYYLMTVREKRLVKTKKEIELLQRKISLTSIQLLMEQEAMIPSM